MIITFPSSRIYRALGMTLVMLLVAVGIIIMLYSERQDIVESVDTRATEDTRIGDLIKITRLANDNKAVVTNISQAFQSATDTVAIIESLETLANEHDIVFSINKAEKSIGESGQSSLLVSVDAIGNWDVVYRFVQSIDKFYYRHQTNRISFDKNLGEESDNKWRVSIDMSIPLATQ